MENLEQIIFEIIIHGGNARAKAYDALRAVQQYDFKKAEEFMKEADEEIAQAHKIQTEIIQKEAAGEKIDITVLFVHAQDHLMTAIAEKGLIENMVDLYKRIYLLEKKGE